MKRWQVTISYDVPGNTIVKTFNPFTKLGCFLLVEFYTTFKFEDNMSTWVVKETNTKKTKYYKRVELKKRET